eukprot:748604-Hanusia_phi.AAC.2
MAVRAKESKEALQTNSSTLRLLYWILQILIARVNPLLDSFIFLALAFIVSLAGHTYQDVYGTRQLMSTFQTRIMGRVQPSSRWNKTSGVRDGRDRGRTPDAQLAVRVPRQCHAGRELLGLLGERPAQRALPSSPCPQRAHQPAPLLLQRDRPAGSHPAEARPPLPLQRHPQPSRHLCYAGDQRSALPLLSGLTPRPGSECYPPYSPGAEDKGVWQGVQWQSAAALGLSYRNPLQYKYQGGSFALDLQQNYTELKQQMQTLRAARWTDAGTRVVFVDLAALNPAGDQFVSARFEFEFDVYGGVSAGVRMRAFRDRFTHAFVIDALNIGAESMLYAVLFVNIFREFGRLRAYGAWQYLGNFWNCLVVICLVFLLVSMIFRVFVVRPAWNSLEQSVSSWQWDAFEQYNIVSDWDLLGENEAFIVRFQALALVTAYIRIFGFMQFFSKKLDDFITSLSHAKNNLFAFLVMMLILLMTFSVGFLVAFGDENANFSSFASTLLSLSEIQFGNWNPASLSTRTSLLTASLMLSFYSLLMLLSASAILALINWATREVVRGKVERETADEEGNLKIQIRIGLARLLNTKFFAFMCGRSILIHYLLSFQHKKAQRLVGEEGDDLDDQPILTRAKLAFRLLVQETQELNDTADKLCSCFGVRHLERANRWEKENLWRKIRNEHQQRVFEQMLEGLVEGRVDSVVQICKRWRQDSRGEQGNLNEQDWRDQDGFSLLHVASLQGDPDAIVKLLQVSADPNARNDEGNSCLHIAALSGQLNACRVLVEGGAECDVVNANSLTPLHIAAYAGQTHVLKFLVEECRADGGKVTSEGLSALHLAVLQGHADACRFLAHSCDLLNVRSNGGETPLHCAVLSRQNIEIVRILLKAGAKVAAKMYDGNNAYQAAAEHEAPPAMRRMLLKVLQMGDDYERAMGSLEEKAVGISMIKLVVAGKTKQLLDLLNQGTDVDAVFPGLGCALHAAVANRKLESVATLVENGADLHVRNEEGDTPVQLAVKLGYFEEFQLMADKMTVDTFPLDEEGNSLLQLASRSCSSLEVVRYLTRHFKMDPATRNHRGQSSIDLAMQALQEATLAASPQRVAELEALVDHLEKEHEALSGDLVTITLPGQAEGEVKVYSKRMVKFFERIGLTSMAVAYSQILAENEVDMDGLLLLTDMQLKELGIKKVGIRNKILQGIRDYKKLTT